MVLTKVWEGSSVFLMKTANQVLLIRTIRCLATLPMCSRNSTGSEQFLPSLLVDTQESNGEKDIPLFSEGFFVLCVLKNSRYHK